MKGPNTFPATVPGVGEFIFRRRTMGAYIQIKAEVSRYLDGVAVPTADLNKMAFAFATLKVLTIKAPEGWNLDALDSDDEEAWVKVGAVQGVLEERLKFFRDGSPDGSKDAGAGTGEKPGVVVSAEVESAGH
ncbi:MAG TPA: hypothetical protein VNX47_05950 [Nevskia sp.]|nr:hypothetical protein [Nevskia sp.]